ncbi:hypothetical protein [Streptomyces sp. BH104]|uniref:hypothetical protein n=1 Tax=Streptomyces sp. BH104 TaxID=3410407 RepID=UPI003BB72E91
MGCGCNKKRDQYQVISAAGKVLFTSGSQPTAKAVSRRYPGSEVVMKDKDGTTKTATSS